MSSKPDREPLRAMRAALLDLASSVMPSTSRVEVVLSRLDEASGSAWLIDKQHWVTNHHVIEGAGERVRLTTQGQTFEADVIGADEATDVALLRAKEKSLAQPLQLRKEPAELGEPCFTFGAPLGTYADSMSMGIVSGLHRRLQKPGGATIEDVIQTDAAINHGNSGGPLVDVDGEVIGINTAGDERGASIGFAVPSATVDWVVDELRRFGSVERSSLGAAVEATPAGQGALENLTVVAVRRQDSALRNGDVLMSINGATIKRRADLFNVLRRDLIEREVPVVVSRDCREVQLLVRFGKRQ